MIIFIDESGDAGFKVEKGSSKFFVIALVIFDDLLEAEETALNIKKLKRELRLRDNYEFKFNKSNREIREAFLKKVKSRRFRVRSIIVNKNKVYSSNLRSSKDKFYNYIVQCVLKHNGSTIKDAKIRLDGLGERGFRMSLNKYLRNNLNTKDGKVMIDLKFRDSKEDVLIQLADMIAGSIRRSYESNKEDSKTYLKIIKNRIEDLWEFK